MQCNFFPVSDANDKESYIKISKEEALPSDSDKLGYHRKGALWESKRMIFFRVKSIFTRGVNSSLRAVQGMHNLAFIVAMLMTTMAAAIIYRIIEIAVRKR